MALASPYHLGQCILVKAENSDNVRLLDFVAAIKAAVEGEAIRDYIPKRTGDIPATWADL